jgi:hypothetical protein
MMLVDYVNLHSCVEHHAAQQKFMVTEYCTVWINTDGEIIENMRYLDPCIHDHA